MLKLHSYFRSSSAYRVRIALNLKGLDCEIVPVHLLKDGGQQHSTAFRALNAQQRVPLLEDGEFRLGQSLAILGYLEDAHPAPPLLPVGARERARVWAFCQTIACDIQPLQNLATLQYLTRELGISEEQKNAWLRHWIERGLAALEQERAGMADTPHVFGETPTLADCVLVPQVFAADRFGCDRAKFPRLAAIADYCNTLPAFMAAHPDRQPDAG